MGTGHGYGGDDIYTHTAVMRSLPSVNEFLADIFAAQRCFWSDRSHISAAQRCVWSDRSHISAAQRCVWSERLAAGRRAPITRLLTSASDPSCRYESGAPISCWSGTPLSQITDWLNIIHGVYGIRRQDSRLCGPTV